jgi:alpha-1,6-mannosyltransferase
MPASRPPRWRRLRPAALAAVAVLLGLTYVLGFLLPLSYARLPEIIPTERPLADALGTDLDGALRFIVPVVIAFLLYGAAVMLARGLAGWRALAAVLGVGLVFAGIFLPTNPVGAQDIYHNVFDARILWKYGDNPNAVPPVGYPDDPLYPSVVAWAEFASVYGPVWYAISGAAYAVGGDDLRDNVYGHKGLTAAFLLGTALLAALAAEHIRRGTGVAAAVAVAWNPLMLFETAGNAHNDIVMVFFAIAAFWALASRRWLLVFPLLALSVGTKYGLILLGPLMLAWLLRRRDVPKRQVWLSLGLGALVGLAVYLPFFQGSDTLDVIRRQSGYNTSSPSAFLDAALMRWGELNSLESSQWMKRLVIPPFLLFYAWQVWRVRGNLAALAERSVAVLFVLMLIATWWFWPWYVIWVVPLAALIPRRGAALVGLLFSASAMLMYVAYFWLLYEDGFQLQAATAAVAFIPPVIVGLAYLIWRAVRPKPQRRRRTRQVAELSAAA